MRVLPTFVQAAGLNLVARTHGHASSRNRSCPPEVVREGTEALGQWSPNRTARGWGRSMPHG